MTTNSGDRRCQRARQLGAIAQGVIFGVLLVVALTEAWSIAEGVRLFRYQTF